MGFIDEEDSSKVGVVYVLLGNLLVVGGEFLNIDHHYFGPAGIILTDDITPDVVHHLFAALSRADDEATVGEFLAGLLQKVQTVNNEVELDRGFFSGEVIGEALDVVVGKSRFAGTLCVPDDAGGDAFVQRVSYGVGGK